MLDNSTLARTLLVILATTAATRMPAQTPDAGQYADVNGTRMYYEIRARLLDMFHRDQQPMLGFTDWKAADIRSITAPALIVGSDQDVVRPEHAVELARLLPHGRLAIFPGRHGEFFGEAMYPHPESKVPELFIAVVDEFLAAPAP